MSKKPNQRADVKNRNNPAHKANLDNRSKQIGLEKQKVIEPSPKK